MGIVTLTRTSVTTYKVMKQLPRRCDTGLVSMEIEDRIGYHGDIFPGVMKGAMYICGLKGYAAPLCTGKVTSKYTCRPLCKDAHALCHRVSIPATLGRVEVWTRHQKVKGHLFLLRRFSPLRARGPTVEPWAIFL